MTPQRERAMIGQIWEGRYANLERTSSAVERPATGQSRGEEMVYNFLTACIAVSMYYLEPHGFRPTFNCMVEGRGNLRLSQKLSA